MAEQFVGTLPLVLKRDELAARIKKERANPHSVCVMQGRRQDMPHQIQFFDSISLHLADANVVVWRNDLFDAATHSAEQFEGTPLRRDILPGSPQWWPLSTLVGSREIKSLLKWIRETESSPNPDFTVQGFLCMANVWDTERKPGLFVATIATTRGIPGICGDYTYAGGRIQSDPYVQMLVAGLSFMSQEFVSTKTMRLPARFNGFRQKYVPMVNQILLRARRQEVHPGSQADTDAKREWEYQWTVRGHWRKLHIPRKEDGQQVTWVRPYLKGNPEGSLLPPRDTIIRVNR